MLGLHLVEERLDVVFRGGVPEARLADSRRRLEQRFRMAGDDAVGGDGARIDDAADTSREGSAEDVLAPLYVHGLLDFALSPLGDEEGEVHEHVAIVEMTGEGRIADVR